MKRIFNILKFLALILVLFFQSCNNEEEFAIPSQPQVRDSKLNVSENLAIEVAKNFSHDQAFLNNPNHTLVRGNMRSSNFISDKKIKSILPFYDSNDNKALLYAINFEPNGFVVVSGNKKEAPILAFSEDGEFKLPEDKANGIYSWLDFTKSKINYLKRHPEYKETKDVKAQWNALKFPDPDDEVVVS